jgi:WD40 repeat protein
LTSSYQFADISTPDKRDAGLVRLRIGLHRAGLHPGSFPWPPPGEPNRPVFRGLSVLEEVDAAIFFGRDTQITKALDAVRRLRDGAPERMLVILGASGAGKSSFLRAGLLARLKRDIERFLVLPVVRPGRSPLKGPTGLHRALGITGDCGASAIATRLEELRRAALEQLPRPLPPRAEGEPTKGPTVILAIDQAEELFAAESKETEQAQSLLADLITVDPNTLLLLTIRSDSYKSLQDAPRLADIRRVLFDLPQLSAAAFKDIIEGPTRLKSATIRIDADLTEQLIEDFAGADALPLLAFTIARLVVDHGSSGTLDRDKYINGMRGVDGAIRAAVERAFAKAAQTPALPQARAELDALARRAFLPGLVRIDDVAAVPKRRQALGSELPVETIPLVECLVDERLLVKDQSGAETTYEVSHEAVLRNWIELDDWIDARREELVERDRVNAAAREWQQAVDAKKAEALVHRGERLRTAERLLAWPELGWKSGDDRRRYLEACRLAEDAATAAENATRKRQRQMLRWIGGLVLLAGAVTTIGAALVIAGQRNLARSQSLTLASAAHRFAAEADYIHASRLAILATQKNLMMQPTPDAWAALSSAAQGNPLRVELRGHVEIVYGAAFAMDERRILTWSKDRTARLWDAASGAPIGPALRHEGPVYGATFAKDDRRILTWSEDMTARLWDAANGKPIGSVFRHERAIVGAVFSKDERRILTWSEDRTARLWDAVSGAPIGPALWHEGPISGAAFSKDERRILTWSWDHTARLWDATSGAPIGPALRHEGLVSGAVFSKDERRILTWSWDKTARLWDAMSGAPIGPALRHQGVVVGAVFSSDERRILTWSWDQTARLWDVDWAMRDPQDPGFVAELCKRSFLGDSIRPTESASEPRVGVRHIDVRDAAAAPILRARLGEDVCAAPPTTWQSLLSLFGLTGQ